MPDPERIASINREQLATRTDWLLVRRGQLARGSVPHLLPPRADTWDTPTIVVVREPRGSRLLDVAAVATVLWIAIVLLLVV